MTVIGLRNRLICHHWVISLGAPPPQNIPTHRNVTIQNFFYRLHRVTLPERLRQPRRPNTKAEAILSRKPPSSSFSDLLVKIPQCRKLRSLFHCPHRGGPSKPVAAAGFATSHVSCSVSWLCLARILVEVWGFIFSVIKVSMKKLTGETE